MDVLFAVTSLPRVLPLADCELTFDILTPCSSLILLSSFAFVEYESRRDADDAYHEMHNKRIGRDDLLKIEVLIHMFDFVWHYLTYL